MVLRPSIIFFWSLIYQEAQWQRTHLPVREIQETWFNLWVKKIPRTKKWQPAPVFLPGKFHGQRSLICYCPWGHNGTPLQYSCLENPMDGGAWWAAVHGVTTSQTWLSDFTFTFHFQTLEKEKATHSTVLAWRIPGTAEPGRLPSLGSHRVRNDWSDLAAAAAAVAAAAG